MSISDVLQQMRRNPAGDWTMADVDSVCRAYGLALRPGKGSHATVKHPSATEILTIPARRPIKSVYIRFLVRYMDRYGAAP
jgi:predicted RNA binding protein YcfA (HicA-like mRNA interferase family)